jgi:hypothetical protein
MFGELARGGDLGGALLLHHDHLGGLEFPHIHRFLYRWQDHLLLDLLQAVVDSALELPFQEAEVIPALLVARGAKLWLRQVPSLSHGGGIVHPVGLHHVGSQLDGTLVVLRFGVK